ncbi:MAG: polysaccharide biosynthesis/export family protein [Dysgonomonas sp.]
MKKQIKVMNLYKKLLYIYAFGGIIIFLGSCISPKATNLLQQREPFYPTKEVQEYQLRINDVIYCTIMTKDADFAETFNGIISVANTNPTNIPYTVYENGNISIPFFGEIKVEGLTINEAEVIIENRMKQSFPDAQVRVRLGNNIFYVVSAGTNGTYSLIKENMTIYQALAVSGNVAEDIDMTKIKIVRTENGRDVIKTFNLRSESVIESEFYYIKPNDVIYYSTSNSSFFRVGSFSAFVGTILLPITFIAGMAAWKFW